MGKATYPSVFLGLLPALAALPDTDDDIEAVVAGVQALSVALGAVANKGQRVVLEVVLELRERPVRALVDLLLGAGKVKSLDSAGRLEYR